MRVPHSALATSKPNVRTAESSERCLSSVSALALETVLNEKFLNGNAIQEENEMLKNKEWATTHLVILKLAKWDKPDGF